MVGYKLCWSYFYIGRSPAWHSGPGMINQGMAARDTDSGVRGECQCELGPEPERGITAEVEQLASCQLNWVIISSMELVSPGLVVSSLDSSHHPTHHHVTLPHHWPPLFSNVTWSQYGTVDQQLCHWSGRHTADNNWFCVPFALIWDLVYSWP